MSSWHGIILHHGVCRRTTPAETVAEWHRARGWTDIGYNYWVRFCPQREEWVVEDGRGDDNIGAHCKHYNDTHIGIGVAGNYDKHAVPDELLAVLVQLCTELCAYHDISPSNIYGHRDMAKGTLCPGKHLHAKLPEIIVRVRSVLPLC